MNWGRGTRADPEAVDRVPKQLHAGLQDGARAIENHRQHINRLNQQVFGMNQNPYEQHSKYTSVIMGIGYAGFFALWNQVGSGGSPRLHALAALLVGASLFVFVAWEIFVMLNAALLTKSGKAMVSEQTFYRVWLPVFIATVATAFAAFVCIFWLMAVQLSAAFAGA